MARQEEIIGTIKVLRKEIEVLTTRLKPAGTGHLHTAIGVINNRIDELIGKAINNEPDQVRGLAGEIFEDVYDGYKEHTEAMEQSRLKRIQNKAAGRDDDVEHSPCYYDTERNRPLSEGLSDRSQFLQTMKQKHGQAVMTTSEMMQEELEPLPINISK